MLDSQQAGQVLGQLGAMHVMYGKPDPGPMVLGMLLDDIEGFGMEVIAKAFKRLRSTYDGRAPITSALLVGLCEKEVGRLSGDEAWALALRARDERDTVIWTDEIERAWWGAQQLLIGARPDLVGARKAFLDAYDRVCTQNRTMGRLPSVTVSMGDDKDLQRAAVDKARLLGLDVQQLEGTEQGQQLALACSKGVSLQLAAPEPVEPTAAEREKLRAKLEQLKEVMAGAPEARALAQEARLRAQQEVLRRQKAEADEKAVRYMLAHPESVGMQ